MKVFRNFLIAGVLLVCFVGDIQAQKLTGGVGLTVAQVVTNARDSTGWTYNGTRITTEYGMSIGSGTPALATAAGRVHVFAEGSNHAEVYISAEGTGDAKLHFEADDGFFSGSDYMTLTMANSTYDFSMVNQANAGHFTFGVFGANKNVYMVSGGVTNFVFDRYQNLVIGGSSPSSASNDGLDAIVFRDGDGASTAEANSALLYATGGELWTKDASGNPTQLSPHNKDGLWWFNSGRPDGSIVRAHMELFFTWMQKKYGDEFEQDTGFPIFEILSLHNGFERWAIEQRPKELPKARIRIQ